MIGRLEGVLVEKGPDGAVVDAGGVGYDVAVPLGTLAALPPVGSRVTFHVHTHVREDEIRLFGFATRNDRTAFRSILKVNGVGPKLALAVLGALSGAELARVVAEQDTKRLSAIPGIGKKTAERIVLELGGKLAAEPGEGQTAPGGPLVEVDSALRNLGFKPAHVDRAIAALRASGVEGRPFEELLRQGLALLQTGG